MHLWQELVHSLVIHSHFCFCMIYKLSVPLLSNQLKFMHPQSYAKTFQLQVPSVYNSQEKRRCRPQRELESSTVQRALPEAPSLPSNVAGFRGPLE